MNGESGEFVALVWVLVITTLLALAGLGWLNVSKSRIARGWRRRTAGSPHALDARTESFPHMHVVDGVTITHAHPGGEAEHAHTSITVSIEHYADLVKRAQERNTH